MLALRRASATVPEETLSPLRDVKLAPDRTGRIPPAVVWTSWEAPLKVLPCSVTFTDSLASSSAPEVRSPALLVARLARDEPVLEILLQSIAAVALMSVLVIEFAKFSLE